MSRLSFIVGLSLVLGLSSRGIAEPQEMVPGKEPASIPLQQVWGYGMKGTRDVRELEPRADPSSSVEELAARLDVWKILKALRQVPSEGKLAGPAFIVIGDGKKALENAQRGFANEVNRRTTLPSDTDLTLVWYSHPCGRYVRLVAVERGMRQFNVKYQFVSRFNTSNVTTHFALIPLGKLSEGRYEVNVEQIQAVDQYGKPVGPIRRDPKRLVSNSFSFSVQRE